jgi:nucleoid-associated protein YgaU
MTRANHILQAGGLALGAALLLGGCATQPTEPAAEAEMTMKEKATKAVSDAEAAVEKTRSETGDVGLWKSTNGILENAQNSLEQGDYQAAIDAANEAEEQAEMGLEQYREEQDEWKTAVNEAEQSGEFTEDEWVGQGGEAEMKERQSVANGTLIMGPGEEGTYRVGSGDNLWDIASADAIYGDPFAWPLIYKANSGKIDDPDLIFPEQEFTIQWDVDSSAYDAAVRHAKTRGAWSLGETEDSDLDYLSQY